MRQNITANGKYPFTAKGGSKTTVYVGGTIGSATLEIHGPGGLIEDGDILALPFQKVVNHGGDITCSLVVTGAGGTDINLSSGPMT